MLPDTIPDSQAKVCLTAFLVFGAVVNLNQHWRGHISSDTVRIEGFFPMGLFPRLMCKAVSWMQRIGGSNMSQQHQRLGSSHARISFGLHEFVMVLDTTHCCIRLDILVENPLEVVDKVRALSMEVLEECAPGLRCAVAVPVDGGHRTQDYQSADNLDLVCPSWFLTAPCLWPQLVVRRSCGSLRGLRPLAVAC